MKERALKIVGSIEREGTAAAFLLFSLLFVTAQILHPNIFHAGTIETAEQWIEHFRGQNGLHIAHLLEFISAPLLIIMALHFKSKLREESPVLSFIGVVLAFIGALMLLGNKSALCLTISGFDSLSDSQLYGLVPGLEVLLNRAGMLGILNLLPLLPLGWILISAALIKSRVVPLWNSIPLLIGSLLLANPEIELINFFASLFLAAGLIPYSITLFKRSKED